MPDNAETLLLYLACGFYAAGYIRIWFDRIGSGWPTGAMLIAAALLLHAVSIGLRWERIGHGPFINMHEILSSNLWSLSLAVLVFLALARSRRRPAARYAVLLPALLLAWLLVTPSRDTFLPATYQTIWLYFHVLSGKLFLGLLLLAAGLAIHEYRSPPAADPARYSGGYRLLAMAFCFQSLMLLFGAVWAQDAWGRYWAWDPLETWAFLTWLGVVFVLHWRQSSLDSRGFAVLVNACLALAILTFFGVPFVSTAPHQGAV